MEITIPQLRAARALLHLKAPDLTEETGLVSASLSRIEGAKHKPTRRTIRDLRMFYESRGVEFGPDGWVRLKPNVITSGNPQLVLNGS